MPDLIGILQTFGVAVFCLVCLGWAVWVITNKVIELIGVPLLRGHLNFLAEITEQSRTQSKLLERVTQSQEGIATTLQGVTDSLHAHIAADEQRDLEAITAIKLLAAQQGGACKFFPPPTKP